jgi:hypothetical protein
MSLAVRGGSPAAAVEAAAVARRTGSGRGGGVALREGGPLRLKKRAAVIPSVALMLLLSLVVR